VAHDVFISYSSKDTPTADAVCNGLEAVGIRCWIAPRDILPGQQWARAIIEAIHSSRLMVIVLSTHSNASEQVLREVERAVHGVIPIIPFRIEEFDLAAALEYYLSTPHWLDAMTGPLEQHLDQLVTTAQVLLGNPASGDGAAPEARPPVGGSRPPNNSGRAVGSTASGSPRKRFARRGRLLAAGLVAAGLVLVLGLSAATLPRVGLSIAGVAPTDGAPPVPSPIASPVTLSGGDPTQAAISDDFEDPAKGWLPRSFDDSQRAEFSGGYEAGYYVIRARNPVNNRYFTVQAPGTYADVSVAVDARIVGDSAGRGLGLSCRRGGPGNEYRLILNLDRGTFAIVRLVDSRSTSLIPFTAAPSMQRGNRQNRVELTCAGASISASINGIVVATVADTTFKEGRVGLVVGTLPSNNVPIEGRFDNLVITRQ
jgi:hypothetical protein